MTEELQMHVVRVHVEGVGTYEVELLSRNAEAAARRAKYTIAANYHPNVDLDLITTEVVETETERSEP